jgi:NitT/TauT family transport system ATP-binding protein
VRQVGENRYAGSFYKDFMDLWTAKKLPIKGVLLVTHNIEEAVLMCDRILLFSSNPGRVAGEIQVKLPQPRHRIDAEFQKVVESIYVAMTQRAQARGRVRLNGTHNISADSMSLVPPIAA